MNRISVLLILITIYPFQTFAQLKDEAKIWNSWERVAELPFSPRDGVGAVHFNHEIWMMGGWKYGPTTSEIFKSPDGINWEFVGHGPWPGRHCAGMVVFNNKIWVLSGDGNPDVWSSENGVTWVKEVESAPWGNRYAPYIVVYNNKIWLMGGISYWNEEGHYSQDFEQVFNDVWSSVDGINWIREVESAPWGKRGIIHGSVVFENEMYIMGGGSKNWNIPTTIYNDVWKTKNGVDWELVTDKAPWNPRIHLTISTFDNKIWLIDGTTAEENLTNEVWFSEDGRNWTQQNSLTKFPLTHASTVFSHNGSLYLSAGFNIDAIYRYQPPREQKFLGAPSISSILTSPPPPLDLKLSSGLIASTFIKDTSIAVIFEGNLIFKKPGNTKLAIYNDGDYGFYPLDTVYVDIEIYKDSLIQGNFSSLTEKYGSEPLNLDFSLASGLTPLIHVEDTTVVEYINEQLVIKNAGSTKIAVISQIDHQNYQLTDTLFIEILIERLEQEIYIEDFPYGVMVTDTLKINAYSDSGLPVTILPNKNILIIDSLTFTPNNLGDIFVEVVQSGNQNYRKSIADINLKVIGPFEKSVVLFPNPTRNVINLTFPLSDSEPKKIIISLLTGKEIKRYDVDPETLFYRLDVRDLQAGIYFLQILSKNEGSTIKFIKE